MAAGISVGALYATLALDKRKFESEIKGSEGLFGNLAAVAKASALVIGAALIGMAAAATKMATSYKAGVDEIRAGTGATGKALDELVAVYDRAVKRVPDDLQTVGKVIADLNTRTGATGKVLEDLAVNLLDFSRITKTDVNANVRDATRLFGDWSIKTEDQAGTLDKVFRASQATGIGVSNLMERVVDFGSPMRLLGFSFEESIALLSKWEKEGVNTETALAGLKYGVKTLASDGVKAADMGTELKARIEAIGKSADPVGLAIRTFGLRAGPDLAAAILEGRFATQDLIDTIVNGSDTIAAATADTRDFGDLWGQVTNSISVAVGERLMPVLTAMLAWLTDNLPAIEATVDAAFAALGAAIDWFTANVIPPLAAAFEVVATDVVPAFGQVIDWLVTNILPPLQSILQTWAENVLPALQRAFAFVQGWIADNWPTIEKVIGQVAGAVKTAVDVIAAVFKAVMPVITKVADVVFPLLGAAATVLLGVISVVFDAIGVVWNAAWDVATAVTKGIGDAFENLRRGIKAVWDGIAAIIRGAINTVIDAVNGMIRAINGIQIHIPKIGIGDVAVGPFDWNGLNLATIPRLAAGSRDFGGGWAMLGERGPELARLPRGTDVFSAAQSRDLLAGSASRGGGPLIGSQTIYGVAPGDVERETRRALRRAALAWSLGGA
jgi:phage-related minor tail protein